MGMTSGLLEQFERQLRDGDQELLKALAAAHRMTDEEMNAERERVLAIADPWMRAQALEALIAKPNDTRFVEQYDSSVDSPPAPRQKKQSDGTWLHVVEEGA